MAGVSLDLATRAVAVPVYRTVAYGFERPKHAAALANLKADGHCCSEISKPTNAVLDARVTALEGGQAAFHYTVSNVLPPSRNMVPGPQHYGSTGTMFSHFLPDLGIVWLRRRIKTVGMRTDRHLGDARRVAEYLRRARPVAWVNYAGFDDGPQQTLVAKCCSGWVCSQMTSGVTGGHAGGTLFHDAVTGRPEYGADTLMQEYGQYARAFCAGQSSDVLSVPHNDLGRETKPALPHFRTCALGTGPDPALWADGEDADRPRRHPGGLTAHDRMAGSGAATAGVGWRSPACRGGLHADPAAIGAVPGRLAGMNIDVAPARPGAPSPVFAPSALLPSSAERRWRDGAPTQALLDARQRVAKGRVSPTMTAREVRQRLSRFDLAAPQPLSGLLPWTIAQLEQGLVQVTHPSDFGRFNPAPALPAGCADRIAGAFDPQLASATTSPAAVAIEAHMIDAVAGRVGLAPGAAGHFTSGGIETNATALTCALTAANPRLATEGARALPGQPVPYVSEHAHLAWYKIAHGAGIGRAAVRLVATDGRGQMNAQALADAVVRDQAQGCVPVMIVATAGTTGAGMINPIPSCAAVARAAGLWLHVDAAWGSALIASSRLRGALAGIEAADSVTIDAHKWLAATMGCGVFLTSRPLILSAAHHVAHEAASCMPSNDAQADPYVTSAQWSRRFPGLRLFLILAATGWEGIAEHLKQTVALMARLRSELVADGWRIVSDSPMAVLCAEPPAGCPGARSIADEIVTSGKAWLTTARFEGRKVVRICLTNGMTTERDVTALAKLLLGHAPIDCNNGLGQHRGVVQ